MITPHDIEVKEFRKAVRGYNPDEVDDFLDEIIVDYENVLNEKEQMKMQIAKLQEEIEALRSEIVEHKRSEASVMSTLDSAKTLMKDISESAEKRADIIVRNAKLDAEVIIKDAKDAILRMGEDCKELRERRKQFIANYREMLTEELNNLDNKESDILSKLEEDPAFVPPTDVEITEMSKSNWFSDDEIEKPEEKKDEKEDDVFRLEDLIADMKSSAKDGKLEESEKPSEEGLDRHTILLSELNREFKAPSKHSNIPTPKETMIMNQREFDKLIGKNK